jgi:hypothetical protein
MILGNSFAFGSFISDSETLPAILQQKLGSEYEVYSLAMPGWGIDQMFLAYNKYVEKIDPDTVVLIFIDDDIWRVFESYRIIEGMNKPSFTVLDGRLKLRDGDQAGLFEWFAERSLIINEFYNKVFKYRECLRIVKALLSELSSQTRRRGQDLIVVRYPYKEEILNKIDFVRDFELNGFFAREGITYLDPKAEMIAAYNAKRGNSRFYRKKDSHPAKAGNEFVADYLLRKMDVFRRQ